MKKYLLLSLLLITGIGAFAQRFAYVDSDYILKHLPEYKSAQNQLDVQSQQLQKSVDNNFSELDKMYKAYQADQVLLTDEMRKKRENDIIEKEKAAKDFQRQKFGPDGDLFQLRVKLLKPIQEKVSKTIADYAKGKQIDFVFDKGSEATMMIYSSSSFDLSDDIITRLGYKPGPIAK
jgi:outer membrane protein